MATTDPYGIDQYLSGPNATTAKQVQQAFMNSMGARNRALARYSLPQLSNFAEDTALTEAQTAAGLINQNQQLQNVIDASHRTPHGVSENLAAYLPYLSGASKLIPWLFGTDATSGVLKNGVFGTVKNWVTDHLGNNIGIDANGNVVGMTDAQGNPVMGQGLQGGWPGESGAYQPQPSYWTGQDMSGWNPGDFSTQPIAPATDWYTGAGQDLASGNWWSAAPDLASSAADTGAAAVSDIANFFG